jgi:hypothetical protein
MNLTRRRLLAGATVSLGLSGCLSDGSNVRYPAAGTPTRTEGRKEAALVEETPRDVEDPAQRETPTNPAATSRLAEEVGRVYGGIAWFATEYDDAIRRYRRGVRRAMATVRRVRESAEFNDNSLRLVRRATDRAVEITQTELGDHFRHDDRMREEVDAYLATIRKFGRRGDLDRTDEELERLHAYLEGIQSDLFVRRTLSDRQIHAPLYRHLHDRTVDEDDDADREDEDEDEDPDPGLFELHHSAGFGAYAYAGPRYIERDPFGDDGDADENEGRELLARLRTRFDAASEAAGRRGFAHVVSYAVPDPDDQPTDLEPLDYPRTSLFVQAYEDVGTATDATESLLSGSVTQEGTYSFGRDEWRRVYYHAGGDVVYAFLVQAGPYVLVAAPSEVAWEERIAWTEALDRLWLWDR